MCVQKGKHAHWMWKQIHSEVIVIPQVIIDSQQNEC